MSVTYFRGDRVRQGIRTGTVIDGFSWRDADDGTTTQQPAHTDVPVLWDDDTQGYAVVGSLEFLYEESVL